MVLILAAAMGIGGALVVLDSGCGSSCLMSAHAAAECDTTSFTDRGGTERVTIRCFETVIDTVFVTDCADTVFVDIEFEKFLRCVLDVMDNPPHGVPMETAIRACIPAQ